MLELQTIYTDIDLPEELTKRLFPNVYDLLEDATHNLIHGILNLKLSFSFICLGLQTQ